MHCWVVVEGDNTGNELGLGGGLVELDQLASNTALKGAGLAHHTMHVSDGGLAVCGRYRTSSAAFNFMRT